jgi:GT2 family glycosyltransferase
MKIIIGIVVFKNDLDLLFKNIKMLLKKHEGHDRQIIILDNDDGKQLEEIKSKAPGENQILFISSKNVGFGAGHNKIFKYADNLGGFDYYLAVNPDGIAHHQMIDNLVTFAKKNKNAGIFEAIQFPSEHPKEYDQNTGVTDWCSGCCCLYPYDIFKSISGFDERFFMYMEDVDLSWRVRMSGNKCYLVNNALFSHTVDNDDRDMGAQELMMQKSAYIIAKKYNNTNWVTEYKKKLSKTMLKQNFREFISNNNNIKSFNTKVSNFDNLFHFSKVRW